jgi:hypothetical protein
MGLWEATHGSATNKPKFAVDDENSDYARENIYATNSGWVRKAGTPANGNDNASAQAEVLVAIGGLAGVSATTGLREATITDVRWITSSVSAGSVTLTAEITWDEGVTVTGSPVLTVINGNEGTGSGRGPHALVYTTTGSTANRKRFTLASQTVVEDDVLTLATSIHNAVTLPGGATIVDTASSSVSALRDLSSYTGTAAATITVVA